MMTKAIFPQASLREGKSHLSATDTADQIRAHNLVDRLSTLRDSIVGVVLSPLLVSLCHFADRSECADILPALLGLLWLLDEMNNFFVGSKAAFSALQRSLATEKRRLQQEAAAAEAAAVETTSRTTAASRKDRKGRLIETHACIVCLVRRSLMSILFMVSEHKGRTVRQSQHQLEMKWKAERRYRQQQKAKKAKKTYGSLFLSSGLPNWSKW